MTSISARLERVGCLCWDRPKTILLAWLIAAVIAGATLGNLSERLLSGAGDIEGSASLRIDEVLRSDFRGGDAQTLILALRSDQLERSPGEAASLLQRLKRRLADHPLVTSTLTDGDLGDPRLAPKSGGHFILLELGTRNVLATEQELPGLRAAIAPLLAAAKARHADLEWAITGRAALTHDVIQLNEEDTARSEIRALPFTLAILIFAFGSLVAGMLPLILAFVTRTVALGIVFLIAGSFDVSNLVLGIVTMLALSLGIDYSLFLVHRYRRELAGLDSTGPAAEKAAMLGAMAQSGTAVLFSAVTVAIGLGALLASPLMETRSIGVGGVLAVLVALLASITLVPALLRLLGPRYLEWPAFLSQRIGGARSQRLWRRWADLVLRHPSAAVILSLAILFALAAPGLQTRFGFPESEFLPPDMEFSRGLELLADMEMKGLVSPIPVIVSDAAGDRALTPERAPLLGRFVARLEQDRRVRFVQGPVQAESISPSGRATIDEAVGAALSRSAFISADRSRLLFRILPSEGSTLAELRALSREVPGWLEADGLTAEVGGQPQYYSDLDRAVGQSYPLTVALVLGVSAFALLLFFRAPLASAKAIVLNLLSVAAGYGVVVLVFQLGHGAELFGLSGGTGAIPITVPLVIFCILFGLSMDYEIFLLSRVRTLFLESGDTHSSIREGLADTGSVITSAALVMVAIFGAFAFARVFIVQMVGLGLAVAVLVDATLIRSMLGPALMLLAGRWNWWPAGKAVSAAVEEDSVLER